MGRFSGYLTRLLLNGALGICIVVLATWLVSCTYSIPKDLPVKNLKLPADAKLTSRPGVRKYDPKPNDRTVAGSWWMDFNSGSSWNDLVISIEDQIRPLGYLEISFTDSNGYNFGGEFRVYYSADGLIEVYISNNSVSEMGQVSRTEYNDYSDYTIVITERREPRERFIAVMETGKHYYPRKDFHCRLRRLQ